MSDCFQLIGRRLAALAISNNFEGYLLSFIQASEACTFDGTDVHEDIRTTTIWRDETEALLGIEPLHGTCCHFRSLSVINVGQSAQFKRGAIDFRRM
jgi:hypothetical protein